MIILKNYQEKAVNKLADEFYNLLESPGSRHSLIFKSPTGSGKTIMISSLLNKIANELPDKIEFETRNIAYVWIAPNKLYIQSYKSIKKYFEETRSIRPVYFEEIIQDELLPNEVLFVNWESINKEKNVMVRSNEADKTLYSFVNRAKQNGTKIVVIIDEEHFFAGSAATRAQIVLDHIQPKVEIRISATPKTESDYKVTVTRHEVIKEQMIKEGIILNPTLEGVPQEDRSVEEVLLDQALNKRNELKQAYETLGVNINPLLLIQLPNDTNDRVTIEDQKYIDTVIARLDNSYNITVSNNKLAIWLSERKENLENIENNQNIVDVLLFKQAIALGWDCPRAAVLLIFRELNSNEFTIQTVGRILRMPEQMHYPNAVLNQGYVYTNISKDIISIVADDANYITMNKSTRIERYTPVALVSSFVNTRIARNRLGSSFRKSLYTVAEELWGIRKDLQPIGFIEVNRLILKDNNINIDVSQIDIVIPENLKLSGEIESIIVSDDARFAKTPSELNLMLRQFARENVGAFAPVDSIPVLELALKIFFEEYFDFSEAASIKIILAPENRPYIQDLLEKSLDHYQKILEHKASTATKDIQKYEWEVPIERIFNDSYSITDYESHVMLPYYENKTSSNPERDFSAYLEMNSVKFDWWYKNGDSGKEHFAIPYIDYRGIQRLFYLDYVIQCKDGTTCLFDTKTAGSDAANVHLKHNALVDYINERNAAGHSTIGGVLIKKGALWKYSKEYITETIDTSGWESFNI